MIKSNTIQEKHALIFDLLKADKKLILESHMKHYIETGECKSFDVVKEVMLILLNEIE